MEKNIKIGYVVEVEGKKGLNKNEIQARATIWENLEENIIALISIMGMDLEKVKQILSYRSMDGQIFINSLGDALRFNRDKKIYTPLIPITHDQKKINVEGEKGYQIVLGKRVHKLVAMNFLNNPKNIPTDWHDIKKYGRYKYQVNHINNYKWDNFILNLNLVDDTGNKKHALKIKNLMTEDSKTIYYTRNSNEIMLDNEFLAKNTNAKIYRQVDFKGDMVINFKGDWLNCEEILKKCYEQVNQKNKEFYGV